MNLTLNSQTQYSEIKVEWSPIQFNTLKCELTGFWSQDDWSLKSNPLRDTNKTYKNVGGKLRFNSCPEIIKSEIQYACYRLLVDKRWSVETLHYNYSKINIICQWLKEEHGGSRSLVDTPLTNWHLSLRTYLTKIGKINKQRKIRGHVNKNGERQNYCAEHDCIYKFTTIYNYVTDYYDDRSEYEKDTWDLRKLGFTDKYVSASHQHKLNFTDIKEHFFYDAAQKYIKYKLPLVSSNTCHRKLLAINKFADFLSQQPQNIESHQINREVILKYLEYLTCFKISDSYRHQLIADIRDFLEICFREGWLDVTGSKLIYDEDLPKYKRTYNGDYIPNEVLDKICNHLDLLRNPVHKRMFLILIESGMRISEICNINFGCLKQGKKEEYLLEYYQFKLKKSHFIPVSKEVVEVIKEQQAYVTATIGKDCPYLFPSSKHKADYKPTSCRPFCNAIILLIHQQDIRDTNGVIWNFHSHQCRHTVGTRMINSGVPQHIIQRYLGHESPTMTQVYAHIHDHTLRKEIEKYHETRVTNFQGETITLEETILSADNDLEWFTKNIQARALEHGYCGRPKLLGNCDIPGFDGCYNCPHWRTNHNFLPILKDTLERTSKVIEKARNCGWELQVNKNEPIQHNLAKVIASLEASSHE